MKFTVSFKTPDALEELKQFSREEAQSEFERASDSDEIDKDWIENRALEIEHAFRTKIEKFVKYGESVRIEFSLTEDPQVLTQR
jgi:transcriptional regulator NrdR family protein